MVQFIPPPDARNLLPPLLACLPLSFASPRAPPVLLPLLSPILRQRVQLLTANSTSPRDSWLPLLCWQSDLAEKLGSIVESDAFELHPISGDVEFREVDQVIYRRLDSETLHARVVITELGLVIIYLWCQGDQEGGGDGWRVAEVRPLENPTEPEHWWPTIGQADEHSKEQILTEALRQGDLVEESCAGKDEDDDDDYWAQYDQTPGRTPAIKRSPAPPQDPAVNGRARATSDAEHYSQYAQVQPALDNDDPLEDRDAIGESTLNDSTFIENNHMPSTDPTISSSNHDRPPNDPTDLVSMDQPRPTSPSAASAAVSRWEEQSLAETAIHQHVSTSIKSLYRLARGVGIERSEFERMVRVELDALGMLEEE